VMPATPSMSLMMWTRTGRSVGNRSSRRGE
jgi:hypothetical protein